MDQLTFFAEERPASHSASPDFAVECLTIEGTLPLSLYDWLKGLAPDGWFGKMCLVFCPRTKDGTLVPLSGRWGKSGMGSPTGFWTLNISECHSDAGVSYLSDILETGDLPQRYFLSAKACAGILRRAEKRGKELPDMLRKALEKVATGTTQ